LTNLIGMGKKGIYWFLLSTGLLLVILSVYTGVRFKSLGAFVEVKDRFEGICKVVAEVPGPEALQLDREEEILYFISNNPCTGPNPRGDIYFLKLDSSNALARQFKFDQPKDFHPHGLSFFRDRGSKPTPSGVGFDIGTKATARDQQGKKYLFTNNHREDGSHTVEIFMVTGAGGLSHEITISGTELTSPNDLVAVGSRQFYVTNDGRSHDGTIRSIDTFLGRKTGNVMFYNGTEFIKVVDNLYFPNGIAINRQSNELFVSETLSGNLLIYQMVENNTIKYVDNFFIGIGIDNISIDDQGHVIAAVHPNLWALSRHMKSLDKHSPSQVFRINYRTKGLKLLYQHNGNTISGVSAAVPYKDDLYIGAVCDNKLLKCSY